MASAADDDDGECSGDDGRTRARVLRSGIGARTKVGGDEIDAVGGGFVGHGARTGLGGEAFNCRIACGASVNDGENAVAAGNEGERVSVTEARAVWAVPDGGVGEQLAAGGVDDRSFLAVAHSEEAKAGGIVGQAGG